MYFLKYDQIKYNHKSLTNKYEVNYKKGYKWDIKVAKQLGWELHDFNTEVSSWNKFKARQNEWFMQKLHIIYDNMFYL